jgi:hypothetical protein
VETLERVGEFLFLLACGAVAVATVIATVNRLRGRGKVERVTTDDHSE